MKRAKSAKIIIRNITTCSFQAMRKANLFSKTFVIATPSGKSRKILKKNSSNQTANTPSRWDLLVIQQPMKFKKRFQNFLRISIWKPKLKTKYMKYWIGMGILERPLLLRKQSSNSARIVKEFCLSIFMILILSLLNQYKARKISGLSI